jgi:hypothetical protein
MQEKKMRRKKDFFGTRFAIAKKAGHLAQDLLWLPLWQFAADFCHIGRSPVVLADGCHIGMSMSYWHITYHI